MDSTRIERIYKHESLTAFKITFEKMKAGKNQYRRNENTEDEWHVTIWYGGGGLYRHLPIQTDTDAYAFAVLHCVDLFEQKRNTPMKWNEKQIEHRKKYRNHNSSL
jgi:hypothetical protein